MSVSKNETKLADLMTEEDVPNTTFLKSVVIILGILIIGVASLIGVTIYKRATKATETAEVSELPTAPALAVSKMGAFGEMTVKAPEGLEILSVDYEGGLMLVTYGRDEEPAVVVVISPAQGKQLGQIKLHP